MITDIKNRPEKNCQIQIVRPNEAGKYDPRHVINTTSHGNQMERTLSPFYLKHVNRPETNIENYWQYSKFYRAHGKLEYTDNYTMITPNGLTEEITLPEVRTTDEFRKWSETGMTKTRADRYPMGKGAKPVCSILNGKYACNYIQARKLIYAPAYAMAVKRTEIYKILHERIKKGENLVFIDYDTTNIGLGWNYVLNDPTHKMGHATVLAALLLGEYDVT